jgi:heparosan-N-sulfate-glucuronate 5-epimerase
MKIPITIFLLLQITSAMCLLQSGHAFHNQDDNLWKYDENGVPYFYYGKLGFQRNPLYIAKEAVNNYEENKTSNLNKEMVINNANWLVDNAYRIADYSLIPYKFPLSRYNLTPPWFSAMAQSHALIAMIYAYNVTKNQSYLDFSKSLLKSFFVDVNDGGITYKAERNGWWYEEYAGNGSNKPRVLNGMLFTLLDIYKYYEYTHDPAAKFLFDQGFLAVTKNLGNYTYLDYSFYDLTRKPAGIIYHQYHASLLKDLLEIRGNDTIRKFYSEWANFRGSFPKNLNR